MSRRFPLGWIALGILLSVPAPLIAAPPAPDSPGLAQDKPPAKAETDPTKDSKNMDETVAYPMAKVLEAARQAMLTYGCDVDAKKEKPNYLECQRGRHMGVMVGSGGEKITVTLTAKGSDTRVEVKTVKGFVGMAGMKNWSTPVYNEIVKNLKGGH